MLEDVQSKGEGCRQERSFWLKFREFAALHTAVTAVYVVLVGQLSHCSSGTTCHLIIYEYPFDPKGSQ
jgi:hypothetical protein